MIKNKISYFINHHNNDKIIISSKWVITYYYSLSLLFNNNYSHHEILAKFKNFKKMKERSRMINYHNKNFSSN